MKVEVKKVPKKRSATSPIRANIVAFCHEFPQYKYEEAKKLPYKQVKLMLKVVHRRQAELLANLLRVANAAQDAEATQKLLSHFEGIADG